MSKIFYDHLVRVDEITALVDRDLALIIDNTMHHHILDEILTHLPVEHHKTFLERLAHAPHDPGLLIFIQEVTVIDIEDAIKKRAKVVKKDLLKEIKRAKRK